MDDHSDPGEYAKRVSDDMDIREMVTVMCELHEDSKVPEELVYDVAEKRGMDRDTATRRVREFVSTVEIVELDGRYLQDREHFDEGFD